MGTSPSVHSNRSAAYSPTSVKKRRPRNRGVAPDSGNDFDGAFDARHLLVDTATHRAPWESVGMATRGNRRPMVRLALRFSSPIIKASPKESPGRLGGSALLPPFNAGNQEPRSMAEGTRKEEARGQVEQSRFHARQARRLARPAPAVHDHARPLGTLAYASLCSARCTPRV